MPDFTVKQVRDSRLALRDSIEYPVYSGPLLNSYDTINANTATSSSISYNLQLPNRETIMARDMLIENEIEWRIYIDTGANIPNGTNCFHYGINTSLQAFPFSGLIQNVSANIGGKCNLVMPLSDSLPALVRTLDKNILSQYSTYTPVLLDNYKFYKDTYDVYTQALNTFTLTEAQPNTINVATYSTIPNIVPKPNSPISGFSNGDHTNYLPRGCHPIVITSIANANAAGSAGHQASTPVKSNDDNKITILVTTKTVEPLFCSPMIWSGISKLHPEGLKGVNQINLNFALSNYYNNYWCSGIAGDAQAYNIEILGIKSKMYVNWLTSQLTQSIPVRSVLPLDFYECYPTSYQVSSKVAAGKDGEITVNNLNWDQIPDKIFVYVRKPIKDRKVSESGHCFFPITGVNIKFSNKGGILSSCSQPDLYRIAVKNGLKMNYQEWLGEVKYPVTTPTATVAVNGVFDAEELTNNNIKSVKSVGSLLIFSPAKDFGLESHMSNGSVGQFDFSLKVNWTNNDAAEQAPDCVVIAVWSGLMFSYEGTADQNRRLITMVETQKVAEQSKFEVEDVQDHMLGGVRSGGAQRRPLPKSNLQRLVKKKYNYS
jgi:hypothetical protein